MTDDELRDLIERDTQIQEMAEHPGWALLEDYMRAQMEAKQRWLLLGNANTVEEYKQVTGWLQGAGEALSAPEELSNRVEVAKLEYLAAQAAEAEE